MGSFVINRVYDKLISLTSAAAGADIITGLVGRWMPDGSTDPDDTVLDVSGNGHDGSWIGAVDIGPPAAIVTTNHSMIIPDHADLTGGTNCTAVIWVKGTTQPTDGRVLFAHNDFGTPGSRGWLIQAGPDGETMQIQICDDDAGTNRKIYVSTDVIFDDTWHMAAFRWTGGVLTLFVDDVKQTSPTISRDDTLAGNAINNSSANATWNGCYGDGADALITLANAALLTNSRFYSVGKSDADMDAIFVLGNNA